MKAEKQDIYGDRKNNAAFMTTEKKGGIYGQREEKNAIYGVRNMIILLNLYVK